MQSGNNIQNRPTRYCCKVVTNSRADLTNPAHAEALTSLMQEYSLDPMGGGRRLSDFTKANLVTALIDRNDVDVILAYIENEAVGLVTCMEGFSTFSCKPLLNIHDAFVNAAYRGQGIITMLLNEAENGNLQSIIFVDRYKDDTVGHGWSGTPNKRMIGELEDVKFKFFSMAYFPVEE